MVFIIIASLEALVKSWYLFDGGGEEVDDFVGVDSELEELAEGGVLDGDGPGVSGSGDGAEVGGQVVDVVGAPEVEGDDVTLVDTGDLEVPVVVVTTVVVDVLLDVETGEGNVVGVGLAVDGDVPAGGVVAGAVDAGLGEEESEGGVSGLGQTGDGIVGSDETTVVNVGVSDGRVGLPAAGGVDQGEDVSVGVLPLVGGAAGVVVVNTVPLASLDDGGGGGSNNSRDKLHLF